jgi:hypothetical protein
MLMSNTPNRFDLLIGSERHQRCFPAISAAITTSTPRSSTVKDAPSTALPQMRRDLTLLLTKLLRLVHGSDRR